MQLRKTLSLNDAKLTLKGDAAGPAKFEGYASVFGGVDSQGDTILRGAFAGTLRKNGLPKMFLEHAAFSFSATGAAALPIGRWTKAVEDEHGLWVEGELTPGMSLSQDVHAAMKHGTLDGLSIGGMVKKGDYTETETGRVIQKWSDLLEISPVAFPADAAARIQAVKAANPDDGLLAAIEDIESVRDLERHLRDAGGHSKAAALALVAKARRVFGLAGEPEPKPQSPEAKAMEELHQALQRLHAAVAA